MEVAEVVNNMSKKIIKIKNINKFYKNPDVEALKDVTLDIEKNEFICVVGPSGCGKSTLMNIIAGLEYKTSGSVTMHGDEIIGPGPDRGVIFQEYALFPWMTVRKNIEYGMKFIRKENGELYSNEEKRNLGNKYIKMVNLLGFEDSYPKALSGGMKQRVAIARGYALNSEILLLDEPFGALDAQTRSQLQEDLLKTWEQEKKTCFFITHDVEEAVLLSTRILIMSARPGRIHEIVDIDLPYPRNQATKLEPEFIKLKNYIWNTVYKMYLEVRK